jgi:hypothetical protein
MNDILLGALIVVFGILPPVVTAYFTWKMALKSLNETKRYGDQLRAEVQDNTRRMYDDIKKYVMEDFKHSVVQSIWGKEGNIVKDVQRAVEQEGRIAGLPAPVKKVVAKGIGNFFEGYGVPKKTITDGILSLLNRPSRQQMEQQSDMIRQYAGVDPNMSFDVNGPQV